MTWADADIYNPISHRTRAVWQLIVELSEGLTMNRALPRCATLGLVIASICIAGCSKKPADSTPIEASAPQTSATLVSKSPANESAAKQTHRSPPEIEAPHELDAPQATQPVSQAISPPVAIEPPVSAIASQQLETPFSVDDTTSNTSTRRLLRWKFAAGDVIRYQLVVDQQMSIGGRQFRNTKNVRFRWTVVDSEPERLSTILVTFERIQMELQRPPFQYDSNTDVPSRALGSDPQTRLEFLTARAMLHSQIVVFMTARGAATFAGAESVPQAQQYMAADFPALPAEPVGVGDRWRVPITVVEGTQQSKGSSEYFISSEQPVNSKRLVVIEGSTKLNPAGTLAPQLQSQSTTSSDSFDVEAGRFLSRKLDIGLKLKNDTADIRTSRIEVTQQLLPSIGDNVPSRGPAATIALDKDRWLTIVPHSRWSDVNKNNFADGPEELEGIKSQFSIDEDVCLANFIVGLKGAKLRCDIVSVNGEATTLRSVTPAADDYFVYSKFNASDLPGPGVYFLHWYLGDAFIGYSAIQIVDLGRARQTLVSESKVGPPPIRSRAVER